MSMLAERKRKTKYSLNPRGNQWAEDSNKFGLKMLEKMGWKHGKGLGAKENGITEHVKVSYKNDSKGMGYKGNDELWTEHEDKFAALLSSLTGETDSKHVPVSSLEKKSQSSRARVHYKKFTRGKDLSRYSEKDLANIFGKKSLKEEKEVIAKIEEPEEKPSQLANNEYLINSGSMTDYFKRKRPNFNNTAVKSASESESEVSHSFGFGFKSETVANQEKSTFVSYVSENKRKAEEEDLTPKKKAKKEIKQEELGLSNPAFNPLSTPIKLERHILETIEESNNEDVLEVSAKTCDEVNLENSLEQSSKKKRKSKKKDTNSGNVSCSEREENASKYSGEYNTTFSHVLDDSVQQSNENAYEVKRKKLKSKNKPPVEENPFEVKLKKKKIPKFAADNSQFDDFEEPSLKDNSENVLDNHYELKKGKKKSKYAVENPTFDPNININDSLAEVQVENPYEVKVKSKKKKSMNGINNCNFDSSVDSNVVGKIEENPYEVKIKKKSSKFAIENPIFDMNTDSALENAIIPEENPYEVKIKKKKIQNMLVNSLNITQSSVVLDNSLEIDLENKNSTHVSESSNCDISNVTEKSIVKNPCEVKAKKKKKQKQIEGISNPALNLNDNNSSISNDIVEDEQLMLNVAVIPIQVKGETSDKFITETPQSAKKRKSVRFSSVKEEIIIPNDNVSNGIDNQCFDKQKSMLDENMQFISKTLDRFEAEIENDLNEEKQLMIGEIGNQSGNHEKLPDGTTKLKFKHANLEARTPMYHLDKTGAKKSYKHLIKGDIVLKFKETNLHEIPGYAAKKETVV